MSSLFIKLSFIHLTRFRVDNARVFQRVSMNLNMTVGQAAYRKNLATGLVETKWQNAVVWLRSKIYSIYRCDDTDHVVPKAIRRCNTVLPKINLVYFVLTLATVLFCSDIALVCANPTN